MAIKSSYGQIVILNGVPRSGKSSIVDEIQSRFDGVWMNLGVDRFMDMTPSRFHPSLGLRPGGQHPDLEPLIVLLYQALYRSIAEHSRLGLNVVVDVGHHDGYSVPRRILHMCAKILQGYPVLLVGVRCPLEVVIERRLATWKTLPPIDRLVQWQETVHVPGLYDLEVDTSQLNPEACAAVIRTRLDMGPPGTAFARLAETCEETGSQP